MKWKRKIRTGRRGKKKSGKNETSEMDMSNKLCFVILVSSKCLLRAADWSSFIEIRTKKYVATQKRSNNRGKQRKKKKIEKRNYKNSFNLRTKPPIQNVLFRSPLRVAFLYSKTKQKKRMNESFDVLIIQVSL